MNKLIVIICLVLTACSISEKEMNAAINSCLPHKGVKTIIAGQAGGWYKTECQDGTIVTGRTE